jgi:hypothetical protein
MQWILDMGLVVTLVKFHMQSISYNSQAVYHLRNMTEGILPFHWYWIYALE